MGKSQPQLPLRHLNHHRQQNHQASSFFVRCSRSYSRIARLFSFKCLFILLLSVSASLSALFSVLHFDHRRLGFDTNDSIKRSATVQAYFRLEKPVSFLIPQIRRLEHDINDEIGVPDTQVAILSMHESNASNWTDVVFGVLSKPMNSPINSVSLLVLRSALIDLFTQQSNLTLTTSIFGTASSFETLKFPGGITIIPKPSPPILKLPRVLFNFTLHNSLHDIEEKFLELKEQLKFGLQLMPYENIFMQVTNKGGSTQDPPVTVQASIVSNLGDLEPHRLKQLAQEIKNSTTASNLGLDNSVFGRVKEISLSSYLYRTLDAPTPSPAPSPDQSDHFGPTISPSPEIPPCSNCAASSPAPNNGPNRYLPPFSNSPAPAMDPSCGVSSKSPGPAPVSNSGPDPSYQAPPPRASTTPRPGISPNLSPLPAVSYGSHPSRENGNQKGLVPAPLSPIPSSSSSANGVFPYTICLLLAALLILHLI